ncbi:MAG TPA: hypothetical protein VLE54_02605, partial [Thermoanaerobaculia bacterium]|nr:hypothetical protein [Thermoanaerobaculia bacterium]
MKSAARTLSLFSLAALFWLGSVDASAQTPGCATLQGSAATQSLPRYAGTLTAGNLSTAGGNGNYLYVLTQWGFARSSLADPGSPTAFTQVIIADEPGSGNGGLIQLTCDCHQGGTAFDAAEAPDGSARMISDFNAARLAPTLLAPAQVARADGSGSVRFGQQSNIGSGGVTQGLRIAAIYVSSSGKYFGYVPTGTGVAVIDMTNTSGSLAKSNALNPSGFLGWTSTSAVRLTAARVNFGGSDLYLLAGATSGNTLRIGTINPASGSVTETASVSTTGASNSLNIALVNGRIFVFSAEGTSGLHAYEYAPGQFGGTLTPVAGSIPGNFDRVLVRGTQFPAIFGHNKTSSTTSFIEIYDSKWVTQGGSAVKAGSFAQIGASEPYFNNSFEAKVKTVGSSVIAYLYRLKSPGVAGAEAIAVAHTIDISCIAADLTAPPTASATMTNLSAASRTGAEATKNYYGDRWRIQNTSSTAAPLDQMEWDLNVLNVGGVNTFQMDPLFSGALPNAGLSDLNPVY